MTISIGGRVAQRLWLGGVALSLLSVGTLVEAGIGGGDRLVRAQGIGSSELDVLGPVAKTDAASSTLVVAGQTVRVSAATKVTAEAGAQFATGSLVAVYGSLNSDGTVAASQINILASSYVAGATSLYVRGVVTGVNPALAKAQVGSLSIDYSSSLYSNSAANLQVGSVVEFTGTSTSSSTLFASKTGVISTSGIGGGDKAISTSGIGGGDKAISTSGIGGGDKAISTSGIGGGDKAISTSGIGGGDKAIVTLGIGGGDKAVSTSGIGGGDKAIVTLGIGGGDKAISTSGIGGGDKAITAMGIGGGDKF